MHTFGERISMHFPLSMPYMLCETKKFKVAEISPKSSRVVTLRQELLLMVYRSSLKEAFWDGFFGNLSTQIGF